MLHIDPEKRITSEDALKHPYVATFHDTVVERNAGKKVSIPVSDTDKKTTSVRARLHPLDTRSSAREAAREAAAAARPAQRCGYSGAGAATRLVLRSEPLRDVTAVGMGLDWPWICEWCPLSQIAARALR